MIQVKNRIKSLPHERDTFSFMVENSVTIRGPDSRSFSRIQVILEAESITAWLEGTFEKQIGP
jgi:hypothetical protein